MKTKFVIIVCTLISMSGFANGVKKLTKHKEIVTLLADIKTTADTYKTAIKKWPVKEQDQGMLLYTKLASAENVLINVYKIMLQNPGKAKKEGITLVSEITKLEKANNDFVQYFENEIKRRKLESAGFVGIGEIIKIVFDTGKGVYDWIKGENEKKRMQWIDDVKVLQIANWDATSTSVSTPSASETQKENSSTKKN